MMWAQSHQPPALPGDRAGWSVSQLSPGEAVGYGRRCPRRTARAGISLLEVLISIFVLAVGLLGVAALIPAGRYEIAQGSRLDNAAMVGRSAFRDLQVRGFLKPGDAAGNVNWYDAASNAVWMPATNALMPFTYDSGTTYTNRVAVALDPLGAFAILTAGGMNTHFPYNVPATGPFLTRIAPIDVTVTGAQQFMDSVFRASVDLTINENATNSDLPPLQYWFQNGAGNPTRRASQGDYSWLATIVSDPTRSALSSQATVSVAVFHKRDLSTAGAGEYTANVSTLFDSGIGGGTVALTNLTSRASPAQPIKSLRPGQWIMLAGRLTVPNPPNPPLTYDYFRWYRVISAQERSGTDQTVTLAGPDWNPNGTTQAFIFDNIVAVYEKNLSLEFDN